MNFCLVTNPLDEPPQSDGGICVALVIYDYAGCVTNECDIKNKLAANAKGRTRWQSCLPFIASKASFTSSISAF